MAPKERLNRPFWVVTQAGIVEQVEARTPQLAVNIAAGPGRKVDGMIVFDCPPSLEVLGRCGRCKAIIPAEDLHHTRRVEDTGRRKNDLRCEGCP